MMNGLFISVTGTKTNSINSDERIVDLSINEEIIKLDEVVDVEEVEEVEEVDSKLKYTPTDNDPILENENEINYEEYSIKDLKSSLESMGLLTSGNKSKLIERIISNKNKI